MSTTLGPLEVLCLGEAMALAVPAEESTLEEAETCSLSFAGAESTVALYLAELGFRVAWVSRVGEDPFGRRILARLTQQGVDTSLVGRDAERPTGVFFKDPRPEGTTVHYYRSGSAAAAMGPAFAEELPTEETRLVHLSGITPALSPTCRRLVETVFARARACGARVSFDVNYRPGLWSAGEAAGPLAEFARAADIVFVGRDEAQNLWSTDTARLVADFLGSRGLVVVKDGAIGATEFDGGASTFVPAPAVNVCEPVGAGDAFAAGYLAQLLNGGDATARLTEGHRLAGRALRSHDDYVSNEQ